MSRKRDPADRRRHLVTLTPKGKRRLDAAAVVQLQAEDELFASLDPEQRNQLRGLLIALRDGLATHPGTDCTPDGPTT